jgi:hypothetical protein
MQVDLDVNCGLLVLGYNFTFPVPMKLHTIEIHRKIKLVSIIAPKRQEPQHPKATKSHAEPCFLTQEHHQLPLTEQ